MAKCSKTTQVTVVCPHVHLLVDDAAVIAYIRRTQFVDRLERRRDAGSYALRCCATLDLTQRACMLCALLIAVLKSHIRSAYLRRSLAARTIPAELSFVL